jgi:purine-nucleoside phosphorylase
MLIDDHINLLGTNPLIGPNDPTLGERFPDMSEPYSKNLQELARSVALQKGLLLQKGVYACMSGPSLETRAEYRMLRLLGADVIGMSTVPEVIVARHAGLSVLGVSVLTDDCFPESLRPVALSEIIEVAGRAEPALVELFKGVIARWNA